MRWMLALMGELELLVSVMVLGSEPRIPGMNETVATALVVYLPTWPP